MGISILDMVVGAVMALAVLRGFYVGMIREGFSVGTIGAVVLGIVYGAEPAGLWIENATYGEIGGQLAKWTGGAIVGLLAGVAVSALGRYLRRISRIVGLGMADRVGGSAIGAAEGALLAMLVIAGASKMFGPDHPAVFNSHSIAMMDRVEEAVAASDLDSLPSLPSVASGPRPQRESQKQRR